MPIFHSSVVSRFGIAKPSRPKPTVHRSCCVLGLCSSKGLIRGAWPKAAAQKTPSAPRPTLDAADCCGLAAPLVGQRRNSFLRAHLDFCCAPPRILLSALSAAVLAISR